MKRWLIWAGLVLIWTIALEYPGGESEELPDREVFLTYTRIAAKTTHVAVYAFLTGLSAWVPMPVRFRWLMMFFLVGHGWFTEWLQELLCSICFRGGSLADVGYDLLGIALGAALTWRSWAGLRRPSDPALPRNVKASGRSYHTNPKR